MDPNKQIEDILKRLADLEGNNRQIVPYYPPFQSAVCARCGINYFGNHYCYYTPYYTNYPVWCSANGSSDKKMLEQL